MKLTHSPAALHTIDLSTNRSYVIIAVDLFDAAREELLGGI